MQDPSFVSYFSLRRRRQQRCPTSRLACSERRVARHNRSRSRGTQRGTPSEAAGGVTSRHNARAASLADAVGSWTSGGEACECDDRSEES